MQDNSDLIIRDCCEAESAEFGKPDTICITVDVLREIVQRHSPGPCLHQIQEPAEYPHLPSSTADVVDFFNGRLEVDFGDPAPAGGTKLYSAAQMRAYVDTDRAQRAAPVLAAPEAKLELACDRRAALTSPDVYNALADLPGMSIALLELDVARGQARAALAATPAMAINPEECAQEVFKNGASVGLFDIPKETANAICAGISLATGARVDWHYIAGRVHIKALAATPAAAPAVDTSDAVAEVHLLEEVCARYADDEDRYLSGNGEAYGSIPTEAGMKARAARKRFYRRKDAATAADAQVSQGSYVSISGELKPDVSVYSTPAAAPVVLPETYAAISEVMELVRAFGDARCSDAGVDFDGADSAKWREAIKSKLRALLAQAATGLPAPAVRLLPWRSIADGLPAWTDDSSIRVIALTSDDDFGGVQLHDITASDFHAVDQENPEEIGTEVTQACTHWAYRDDVWPRAGDAPASQLPVLYVSKEQLDNHRDPDGPGSANAGRYLPARKTPAGKLTTPLFAAPAQADARDADGMYYLQDARWSAMVGNCPSFWRLGGGYTTNLDDAERFTLEAAMKQHKCRETDLPWLCSELDKLRRPTVDCQYIPRSWDAQRESIAAIAAAKGE